MIYKTTRSALGIPCIDLNGGDIKHHNRLRQAMYQSHEDSETYKLREKAGAVLVGQGDASIPWTLVVFQKPDYQGFLDHLNAHDQELDLDLDMIIGVKPL